MRKQILILTISVFSFLLSLADENLVPLEYAEIDGELARGWFASPETIKKASESKATFEEILGSAMKFLDKEVKQILTGPLGETLHDVDSWSFTGARVLPISLTRTRSTPGEWKIEGGTTFFYLLSFWALDSEGGSLDLRTVGVLSDLSIIELDELPATDAEMEWDRYTRAEVMQHQQNAAGQPATRPESK